jgi:HD superfamily phosphodiesterase
MIKALLDSIWSDIMQEYDGFRDWAHGPIHARRVGDFARTIASKEDYDPDLAQITGWCHDLGRIAEIGQIKIYPPIDPGTSKHASLSLPLTKRILGKYDPLTSSLTTILDAIEQHSDKTLRDPSNKLAQILMDADRLDGWGYWGLIRMAQLHGDFGLTFNLDGENFEKEARDFLDRIFANQFTKEKVTHYRDRLVHLTHWYDGNPKSGVQPLNTRYAREIGRPGYNLFQGTITKLNSFLA